MDQGPLPKHGLVRNQLWECIELNNLKGYAKFELDPGESFHPSWPYPVRLVYTVDIGDSELTTTLEYVLPSTVSLIKIDVMLFYCATSESLTKEIALSNLKPCSTCTIAFMICIRLLFLVGASSKTGLVFFKNSNCTYAFSVQVFAMFLTKIRPNT